MCNQYNNSYLQLPIHMKYIVLCLRQKLNLRNMYYIFLSSWNNLRIYAIYRPSKSHQRVCILWHILCNQHLIDLLAPSNPCISPSHHTHRSLDKVHPMCLDTFLGGTACIERNLHHNSGNLWSSSQSYHIRLSARTKL